LRIKEQETHLTLQEHDGDDGKETRQEMYVQCVSFIGVLSTAGVTGYDGGCRLSMR